MQRLHATLHKLFAHVICHSCHVRHTKQDKLTDTMSYITIILTQNGITCEISETKTVWHALCSTVNAGEQRRLEKS